MLLFDDLAEVEDLLRGRVVARMVCATVCRSADSVHRVSHAVGFDGIDGQLRLGVLLFDDLAEVEHLRRVVARMVCATVCRCADSVYRVSNAVGFDGVDGHVILVVRSDRTLPLIALRANAQA